MSSDSLQRLQEIERTLHAHTIQKQSFQSQLSEVESALKELKDDAYRIIGNIMVKTDPKQLREELEEKKQTIAARVDALERQEDKLRKEMEEMQQQLLKGGEDGKV